MPDETMTLFSNKKVQRIVDNTLAVLVMSVLLYSFASPQSVEAETLSVAEEFIQPIAEGPTPEPTFPVSEDIQARYTMNVVATAYSSDPRQTDATPCTPAMGSFDLCENFEKFGTEDTIAANFLPLGTMVRFPDMYGDKIFVVRDRMNARYNGTNRVDLWIGSATPTSAEIIAEAKNEARQFGVKRMRMEVLGRK